MKVEVSVEGSSKDFQIVTDRLLQDLDRLGIDRIQDFTQSTKCYLNSMLETQREVFL